MILIIVDDQSQISTDGYMPQVSEDAVFKRQQMMTPVVFKMIPKTNEGGASSGLFLCTVPTVCWYEAEIVTGDYFFPWRPAVRCNSHV